MNAATEIARIKYALLHLGAPRPQSAAIDRPGTLDEIRARDKAVERFDTRHHPFWSDRRELLRLLDAALEDRDAHREGMNESLRRCAVLRHHLTLALTFMQHLSRCTRRTDYFIAAHDVPCTCGVDVLKTEIEKP